MAGDYSLFEYVGDCEWRLIKSQPSDPANEMETQRDTWFGRTDKLEQFLQQYPLYAPYTGEDGTSGYITLRSVNDDGNPFSTVDLQISLPPDFQRYLVSNGWGIKTASASANVTGSNLIPSSMLPDGADPPDSIQCTRSVSFFAPESQYTYFASSKPSGPRFNSYSGTQQPFILSSRISCNVAGASIVFAGAVASAPIVAALTMPLVSVIVSTTAEQIPGTPWYRCKDGVALQYQGDST